MAKLRSTNIEPSTATTLALGASGDSVLISSDSLKANTWQDLGGNNFFVSNGSGTLSNVNSGLSGGGYSLISSTTFSGQSTVNITSGIDSTYDEYVFVCTDLRPSAQNGFEFQTSTDGGTSWGVTVMSTNFRGYNASNSTTGLSYLTGDDNANTTGHVLLTETNAIGMNVSTSCSAIELHLFQPSSTTYVKQFYSQASSYYSAGAITAINQGFVGGYFNSTTALNAIQFQMQSGTFDGTIQMYGVS